jgi:peptidoglycan-N-acetylglucosamine deacetylase
VITELNRRRFLGALAAATLAGVGVARYTLGTPPRTVAQTGSPQIAGLPPAPALPTRVAMPAQSAEPAVHAAALLPPPAPNLRVRLPGGGMLNRLSGQSDLLALTVDDGVNSDVVRLYTQFAKDTGVRLTYFVNGTYRSWTDNLALLRPLVDSGQIQLGNHTWSHPDLTTVPKSRVADEITRNHQFLKKTFGVDAAPYFRPPYGKHNPAVDAVAADVGYTVTTLWSGTLSDSTPVTGDYIVKMAKQYFTPQSIVLGHLNHLPVTQVYAHLVAVIRARNLRTVTLDDVYLKPA